MAPCRVQTVICYMFAVRVRVRTVICYMFAVWSSLLSYRGEVGIWS